MLRLLLVLLCTHVLLLLLGLLLLVRLLLLHHLFLRLLLRLFITLGLVSHDWLANCQVWVRQATFLVLCSHDSCWVCLGGWLGVWLLVYIPVVLLWNHHTLLVLGGECLGVDGHSQVDSFGDVGRPAGGSLDLLLGHDGHGWLQDLNWQRYDFTLSELVPGVVLNEDFKDVAHIDELATNSDGE